MHTSRAFRRHFLAPTLLAAALFTPLPALAVSQAEVDALRAKAERGNPIAQYNLGLVYADPREPSSDFVEAYVWLNLAAQSGATGNALNALLDRMSNAQISEAQRRLEARRAAVAVTGTPDISRAPITRADTPAETAPITRAPIERADLQGELITLRAEQRKLAEELAAARQENEALKASSNGQVAEAGKRAAIAEAALATREKELATLKAQPPKPAAPEAPPAAANAERERLVANLNTASTELATLRASTARLEAERASLQQQLTAAQEKARQAAAAGDAVGKAETARAQLARDLAAAQQQSTQQRTAAETATRQLRELEQKLAATQKDAVDPQALAAATQAKTRAETELADLKTQFERLTEESRRHAAEKATLTQLAAGAGNTAQQQVASLTSQLERARHEAARAGELNKTLEATRQQLAQATAAANEARTRADAAAQARTQAETALAQLRATPPPASAPDRGPEIAALQRDLDATKGDAARLTRELTEARTALDAATSAPAASADLDALRKQVGDLSAQNLILRGEADSARKAGGELESKLQATLRTYTLQQTELERVQAALANIDGERASLAERLTNAQTAQAETARAELDTVKADVARLSTESADRQNALAQANRELAELRTVAATAGTDLTRAREQLRQVQANTAVLIAENQQLKTRLALTPPPPASTLASPTRPGSAPASAPAPSAFMGALPQANPSITGATPGTPSSATQTRTHVVASGDSLTKIARQYYGTASRWLEILDANREAIRDPNALTVGSSLRIP